MASYETSAVTKSWIQVRQNLPCFGDQLGRALVEARNLYYEHKGVLPASETEFEVIQEGDDIVVQFETTEKRSPRVLEALEADLRQACELLKQVVSDCINDGQGHCMKHARTIGQRCAHAQARDFTTRMEENPHG